MCPGCCFPHPFRVSAHQLVIQRRFLLLGEPESAAAAKHSSLGGSLKYTEGETSNFLFFGVFQFPVFAPARRADRADGVPFPRKEQPPTFKFAASACGRQNRCSRVVFLNRSSLFLSHTWFNIENEIDRQTSWQIKLPSYSGLLSQKGGRNDNLGSYVCSENLLGCHRSAIVPC
jgi:hypothetical protein